MFEPDLFGEGQTITLAPNLDGLPITTDVTIIGPGADLLAIDGTGNRVFAINDTDATVSISGLTIQGASSGVVSSGKKTTLSHIEIINSSGYAILHSASGSLVVNQSTIAENGGGIFSYGELSQPGSAHISNTTISNNTNHGVLTSARDLTFTNSTIALNGYDGIASYSGSQILLQNSIVIGNGQENLDYKDLMIHLLKKVSPLDTSLLLVQIIS